MARKFRTREAVSAGGIVYRYVDGRLEFLLGVRNDRIWMLPKGTPRVGETIEAAAAREVEEETGLCVEIEDELGNIEYWFIHDATRFHKTVHHFLFRPVGGDTSQHDWEFDRVEWVPGEEAIERLTYPNEAEIARRGLGTLRERQTPGDEKAVGGGQ